MIEQIAAREFREQAGVEDWRVVGDGACTYVRTGSFEAGARLVQAISELPGLGPHQPDIDLRHDGVTVRLVATADDYMGMSTRDVELAREISRIARDQGLSPDPSAVESVLLVIDALDIPAVMRFWRALLDYEYRPDSPAEDLVDRHWRWPGSGSSRWTSRGRNATGSTSRSGCRSSRQRTASRPRSPPAARS